MSVSSPRRIRATAVAVMLALSLSACQPGSYAPPTPPSSDTVDRAALSDIDWLDAPRDWVGPSTATLSTTSVTPVTPRPPTPQLPVTVTSDDLQGPKSVDVASVERIIAVDMSGSLAHTVWGLGLGDRLVGRDISTTFPGTENLPVVTGTGHAISPESVLSLRPDLIITDGTVGPIDVMLQLRQAGVTVVFIQIPPGVSQAPEQARRVAQVLGVGETGELLAQQLAAEISEVTATIAQRVPPNRDDRLRMIFLYLRGSSGIYYLFGSESGAGELIEAVGGIDVAGEIGWTGLRPVTDEALIAANPDLILVMSTGLASVGGVEDLVRVKPAIGLTRAGQNRRFVDMADSEILSFGPRTPLVIDGLARAIYSPWPDEPPAE